MKILYEDEYLAIAEKDASLLSEPDGKNADVITETSKLTGAECLAVHRLDRGTGGAMAVAKTKRAAAALSELVRDGKLKKEYLAVVHGCPAEMSGEYRDLLFKDSAKNKSFVVSRPRRGVREAVLRYEVIGRKDDISLIRVMLDTGRTHQIRVQFSSRRMPLVGDGKYGSRVNRCGTALWSSKLSFTHPFSGEAVSVSSSPPDEYPWNEFR